LIAPFRFDRIKLIAAMASIPDSISAIETKIGALTREEIKLLLLPEQIPINEHTDQGQPRNECLLWV